MASLAIYNSKGGVGKTTIAMNLAGQAAQAGYHVLLWEFDSQGDCGWLFGADPAHDKTDLGKVMHDPAALDAFITLTRFANLSLLVADERAQNADNLLNQLARQQKLLRLFAMLGERFDLIIFDCPPGRSDANVRLLQNVDLIIAPSLPSPLAMRGLLRVRDLVMRSRGSHAPILPVFSMVDVRRKLHKDVVAQHSDWPILPYLSDIEQMLVKKAPLCMSAPRSKAAAAYGALWRGIENKLRQSNLLRLHAPGSPVLGATPCARDIGPQDNALRRPGILGTARRIYARSSQISR